MIMEKIFIVHYHEIALKGRNRDFFEKKLVDNISKSLKSNGCRVRKVYGKILVFPGDKSDLGKIQELLGKVFGIAYFAPAYIAHTKVSIGEKVGQPLAEEIWP